MKMTQKGSRMTMRGRKGFTLVEILIAMVIFSVFIAVLMSSYITLIKAQRDADDYRIMYSEARRIFDKITTSVKNNSILYSYEENSSSLKYEYPTGGYNPNGNDGLVLVSKDGKYVYDFTKDSNNLILRNAQFDESGNQIVAPVCNFEILNSPSVEISDFHVLVAPAHDPYDEDNVSNKAMQFQPKVTIFVEFKRVGRAGTYTFPLQTTISSRFYGPGTILKGAYTPCVVSSGTP